MKERKGKRFLISVYDELFGQRAYSFIGTCKDDFGEIPKAATEKSIDKLAREVVLSSSLLDIEHESIHEYPFENVDYNPFSPKDKSSRHYRKFNDEEFGFFKERLSHHAENYKPKKVCCGKK